VASGWKWAIEFYIPRIPRELILPLERAKPLNDEWWFVRGDAKQAPALKYSWPARSKPGPTEDEPNQ
jgi:hypothetical protein